MNINKKGVLNENIGGKMSYSSKYSHKETNRNKCYLYFEMKLEDLGFRKKQ
jgi:hypothetical protein